MVWGHRNNETTDTPMTDTSSFFRAGLLAGAAALALAAGWSARAQETAPVTDTSVEAPLPGFSDPYNRVPVLGYQPGRSALRLANMRDEGATTNIITIYGLDEKQVLGTVQVEVPAKASVQVQPHLLLETFAPVNWRQPVVLYIENGHAKQLWQLVKFDRREGRIEDASVCTNSPHADYIPARQVVLNAQVNRVGYLSSRITVHNFSDRAGTFEARMSDAGTGQSLGKVEITVGAQESLTESGLWYFDHSDIVYIQAPDLPGSMNIEFVPKAPDNGARLAVQHQLLNYASGEVSNLSNPCAIHGGTITLPPIDQPQ